MITQEIWKKIKEAQVITIFRHVKPDGDATGSQMGLKELIKANCPDVLVYCLGDPNAYYGCLLGNTDINVTNDTIANSLAIVLDTPNIERIDDSRYALSKDIIKIDHHLFVDEFANIEWICPDAGSTCQMVVKLARDNSLTIPPASANALYLGMVTDSNRFLYSPSCSAFCEAAYLTNFPIDYQLIYRFLYEIDSRLVRFKGYCQMSFKTTTNGVAYNEIDEDILERFHVSGDEAAGAVNAIAGIKGIKVHVHFCALEDDMIRVEFRSKDLPVNEIAKRYGGGGHKLASGAKVHSWEIVDKIIKDLDDLCREEN